MQFIDKKDRVIKIEFDGRDAIANHLGKEIGTVSFDFVDEDYQPTKLKLCGMNIIHEYRRAGIATELMRAAVADIGKDFERPDFLAVGGSQARSSDEYFTDDGTAFFQYLIKSDVVIDKAQNRSKAKRLYDDEEE